MFSRLRRIPWTRIAFAGAMIVMVRGIALAVNAPPTTRMRPADEVVAAREEPPPPGTTDVRIAPPSGTFVSGNGRVEPMGREVQVAAATAGIVQRVRVKEGDRVEAGAVLAELATSVERAALSVAEADLSSQRALLARLVAGVRSEDRAALAAELAAARSRADLAAAAARRAAALAQSGAATGEEQERTRHTADEAAATASAAEARSLAAVHGSRPEEIAQQRAQVAAAEARVNQARASLDRLSVRAPSAGEVLDVKVLAGEYWQPASGPVAVLGDTSALRVRMEVDERDIQRVRIGNTAFVTADAFGDRRFPGHVVSLGRRMGRKQVTSNDPAERKDTQVLEVVLELDSFDGLVPGLRVTAYVTPTTALRADLR